MGAAPPSAPQRLSPLPCFEPDSSTAFLFVNKSRDCLLLFSTDSDGDRTLTTKIEKGAFIRPALLQGDPVMK